MPAVEAGSTCSHHPPGYLDSTRGLRPACVLDIRALSFDLRLLLEARYAPLPTPAHSRNSCDGDRGLAQAGYGFGSASPHRWNTDLRCQRRLHPRLATRHLHQGPPPQPRRLALVSRGPHRRHRGQGIPSDLLRDGRLPLRPSPSNVLGPH